MPSTNKITFHRVPLYKDEINIRNDEQILIGSLWLSPNLGWRLHTNRSFNEEQLQQVLVKMKELNAINTNNQE